MTLDTKISFNEATFGFVPHAGSSYYLSRLPGEIGTFLALTGFPITGIDAKEFGIADELVHYSEAYEEDIAEILFSMDFPVPNHDLLSNKGRENDWRSGIEQRQKFDEQFTISSAFERARKKQDNIIHEEFMEPRDKIPALGAETDEKYKKMLKQYDKKYQNPRGYLEVGEGRF